jgi:hypothetical protein
MDQVHGGRVDNSWAWLLAATPLLFVLIDASFLLSGYAASGLALASGYIVAVGLLLADQAALRRSEGSVHLGWGLLLMPIYLVLRARATRQSYAQAALWIAAVIAAVAAYALLVSAFARLDINWVEAFVKEQADDFYGTAQRVDCPDREVYRVGAQFLCDVADAEGVAQFPVKVEDAEGTIYVFPPAG